jgi:hypothetical protein
MLDQRLVTEGKNRLTIHIGSGIENSVLLANILRYTIVSLGIRKNFLQNPCGARLRANPVLPV